jgi:hypothetical protein
MEDMAKLFKGEDPRYIVNKEVLGQGEFKEWLGEVKEGN